LRWSPNVSPEQLLRHERDHEATAAHVVALGLVFASVAGFGTRSFSDTSLLAPCLGAGLALYDGGARLTDALLPNPVSVGIGRVSYSAYLVHWPIIVFVRYQMFGIVSLCPLTWLIFFDATHFTPGGGEVCGHHPDADGPLPSNGSRRQRTRVTSTATLMPCRLSLPLGSD
jgi:hypothetical protein